MKLTDSQINQLSYIQYQLMDLLSEYDRNFVIGINWRINSKLRLSKKQTDYVSFILTQVRDRQAQATKKSQRVKLTVEQQRELTYKQQLEREQAHMLCPMELRVKGPHTGLYCAVHGAWIRWISQQDAEQIKDIL